jgi:hypothetical protein
MVVLTAVAVLAYLLLPAVLAPARQSHAATSPSWYWQLARAMLNGRVHLDLPFKAPSELIPAQGPHQWYVAYPPVPAVVLMPFAAILAPQVGLPWIARLFSVANVLLFDWMLRRLNRPLRIDPLSTASRLWFGLLFALGTMTWHVALVGRDWHWAHVVATGCILLALGLYARRGPWWLVGLLVGLALGARPTAGLTGVFFVLMILTGARSSHETLAGRLTSLAQFAAGPIVMLLLLGAYNWLRFGDPADFGYDRMMLVAQGRDLMNQHGQFNARFVLTNLYWFFVAPPVPVAHRPWVLFDPMGMGLLLTTPAVLWCFRASFRTWLTPAAWIAVAFALVPLSMYFGTGYAQFGHRYGMDYLPMLMVLLVVGMGDPPWRLARAAIAASVLVHAWGNMLWLRLVG